MFRNFLDNAGFETFIARKRMLIGRQNEIIDLARRVGRVTVDSLAGRFGVTPQTIRKDLNDLCQRGYMERVHGGAVIASTVENVGYEARRIMAQEAKRGIGQAAASLIPNNSSLLINIGTTTEEVAKALRDHQGLLVIIAGGVVRHSDGGIVGEAAVDFIGQFKVDFAVIGASAIDTDGALLDFDYREVRVAQAIIANARHVILVCDATKFERPAPVRIAHLTDVHTFVTDVCRPPAIRRICADSKVRLIEVGDKSSPLDD
jgi:DeoR family transcriptional regulator, glycerol-3-phosphate regulon repressor